MRIHHVLIDAENVKPDHLEKLGHAHFKVSIFYGAKQKHVDKHIVQAMQTPLNNVSCIFVNASGRNALDFHIAYHLGKLTVDAKHDFYYVISKNAGYDTLLSQLTESGITCSRFTSITEIPLVQSVDSIPAKDRAMAFYTKRLATDRNAPGTLPKLLDNIANHFNQTISDEEVGKIASSLRTMGYIKVSGEKISYPNL
jgi:hypothetical protein